ncbi:MAG: hypothetical protein A2W30_05625 [Ignavibacteria bacterium RBG_16_36_9]|nr:MAG: hypothetical protein A2W30_05625 [Ignavibacteria bacterium RBG_16_36_9]
MLVGSIPQKKVYVYFQAADMFIMPSLREGSPRVILEGMAAGLPIIATDVGEVRNILPLIQKQFIIKPNNMSKMIQAIRRIINNKKLSKTISDQNKKRVKQFNLKNTSSQLTRILEEYER